MRYDNWDIILFPEDSNIPIPEYKTACYFSKDEGKLALPSEQTKPDGHELPTLRTYIGSLKPETPFRISVHHWGPPKPSPLMQEAGRKAGLDITFTVRVLIDDATLYFGSFAVTTSSPQEIAYVERSFKPSHSTGQPTSQPKQRLLFPRSDKNALLQSSAWQPRGTDNRIRVLLSERLVNSEGGLESIYSDIVCFSFQHAPRELLEQAGIAYPIIDPLRSLVGERATFVPTGVPRNTMARDIQLGARVHSGLSPELDRDSGRPPNPEPNQQPSFIGHRGGGHPGPWSNLYSPYLDNDVSMASLQSQRTTSGMSGLQGPYDAPFSSYAGPYAGPWPHNPTLHAQRIGSNVNSARLRKDNDAQHVMMAFRDDQFGQILEAISPSKKQRDKVDGLPSQHYRAPQQEQSHRPPKMAALSVPVRPSSAAIARSTASSDFTAALQKCARKPSFGQENFSAKAPAKRSSHASYHDGKNDSTHSRASEQNPFVRESRRWDSDVSMRDGSSNLSNHARHSRRPTILGSKLASAHAPSAGGDIRGRKEGLAGSTTEFLIKDARHDPSLLLAFDADPITRAIPTSDDADRTPPERPKTRHSGVSGQVEVIDVDAIDPNLAEETTADLAKLSPFERGRKASMSSISSTGRLERQLYSALGEELGSFEQQMNADGMGPELAQALSGTAARHVRKSSATLDPTVREFEPAVKRKRRGTISGEANSSPIKKKDKAQKAMVEDDDIPEDMPQLRGD